MSAHNHLTIYEPEKDPRFIQLPINASNLEGNDLSVFNEDGTVLEDYQLYLEDTNQLIKVPTSENKSERKWERLKFWRKWVNTSRTPKSVINDIPVSETVRDFLKTYPTKSAKKERKIARVKDIRNAIAEKKSRRKMKKERKKALKRLLAENPSEANCTPPPSVPLKRVFRSVIDEIQKKNYPGTARKLQQPEQGNKSNSQVVPLIKDREHLSKSAKRRRRMYNLRSRKTEIIENNFTSPVEQSSTPSNTITNVSTTSENVKHDSPSVRWKATEPALDFIPINTAKSDRSNDNLGQSENFLAFNNSKNSISPHYGKFISDIKDYNSRMKGYNSRNKGYNSQISNEDEFIGISKKAFFLQC